MSAQTLQLLLKVASPKSILLTRENKLMYLLLSDVYIHDVPYFTYYTPMGNVLYSVTEEGCVRGFKQSYVV